MARAEFLLVGDLHIGRLEMIFPHKDWQTWSMAPLYQVEEYAINNGIGSVIQTGDVFDVANPGQHLLQLFAEFLLKSKLRWFFGIGNHDISHRGKHSLVLMDYLSRHRIGSFSNCRFFPTAKTTRIEKIPVIFLPYPQVKSKLLRTGQPSLVIAHAKRKGMSYDNGRVITDSDFSIGPHFWCIGHLHQEQTDTNVLFPGTLLQLRHGDNENKCFFHLRINSTTQQIVVKFRRVPVATPFILRDLQVESMADLRSLRNSAPNIFYRLCMQHDFAASVPEKYTQHPQVIDHKYYGDKRDLRAIQQDMFNLQTAKITEMDRMAHLDKWLRQNTRLNRWQIVQAINYAKRRESMLMQVK